MDELRVVYRFAPKGVSYTGTYNLSTGTIRGIPKEMFQLDLSLFAVTTENFQEYSPPFDGTLYEVLFRHKDALAVINYSNVNVVVVTQDAIVDYNLNTRRTINSFTTGSVDRIFNFPVRYFGVEKPMVKTYEITQPIEFLCQPVCEYSFKIKDYFEPKEEYEEINPDEFKIDNYRAFAFDESKSKIVVVNGEQIWVN